MDIVAPIVAFLDALPNAGRGLLGALLLLLVLLLFDQWVRFASRRTPPPPEGLETRRQRWRRLRRSFNGYRWRSAHTKTSLLALLVVPLVIALMPDVRMPVYVETLPRSGADSLWWLNAVVAVWLLIAAGFGVRLVMAWRARPQSLWPQHSSQTMPNQQTTAAANTAFDQAPDALANRQSHWQRRLGYQRAVSLRIGPVHEPMSSAWRQQTIDLPRASAHWPAAATDVALIVQLCHLSLNHHRWLRFAALVGCLYWPFGFVRKGLPDRLAGDFEQAARDLAQACYRDPLGFRRAEKQLHDRLGFEPEPTAAPDPANAEDPYGRVFMVFAQALLVVYVLTGTTLKEIPDDSNFQYAEFVHNWYEKFQRSVKYTEDAQEPDSRPP